MELIVVGLNHQTTPLDVREKVAFRPEQTEKAVEQLTSEGPLEESVILSTCNRSEIYGVSNGVGPAHEKLYSFVSDFHGVPPALLQSSFYTRSGPEVARHLFRVVSSLDSMILGEPHILGQVRTAFLLAVRSKSTGLVLNRLFQTAAQVGKRVRVETEIGVRPASISTVAVELAIRVFSDLKPCSILVLGAGETGQTTVRSLLLRGAERITVTNRSPEKAETLAREFGGRILPWESWTEALPEQDIVVGSVQADHPLLTRDRIEEVMKQRRGRPLFLIDLGVPRNFDPGIRSSYNVFLRDIDDLQSIADENRQERQKEIPKAEGIIEEEVGKFTDWWESLPATSLIRSLRQKVDEIREEELQAHLKKLGALSEHDRNIVAALSHAIVNKILHEPTVQLKRSRNDGDLKSLRQLFDLREGE